MSTETKQKEVGIQAKRLLENELLIKWWESAERALYGEFILVPATDIDALRVLKARVDALQSMQKDLKRYVTTGKNAEKVLSTQ